MWYLRPIFLSLQGYYLQTFVGFFFSVLWSVTNLFKCYRGSPAQSLSGASSAELETISYYFIYRLGSLFVASYTTRKATVRYSKRPPPDSRHYPLSCLSFKIHKGCLYLTGDTLHLRYKPNSLMRSIGLWSWYINITITILDIIHGSAIFK
jgi:hypothetical protein